MDLYSYEEKSNPGKCAIIGCGKVGSAIAGALAQTGAFKEMVLLDVDFEKAEGEAADIANGLSHRMNIDVFAGDYADLEDCGLIVLSATTNGILWEAEAEIFRKKTRIVRSICKSLRHCNGHAVLLIVSAPVDKLSDIALAESKFPKERVLGIGTLPDSARLSQLLGMHLGVNPCEISSFVIGEHGENEFPAWSHANVRGIALPKYYELCGRSYDHALLEGLFFDVKDSSQRIVKTKENACFAIAEAVKLIALSIANDENRILSVSTYLSGTYGLEGIFLSLPCVIGKGGIKQVLEIPLSSEEEDRLRRTVKKRKEALEALQAAP